MQSTNLPWIVEVADLEDVVQMHSTILEKIVKIHPVLCGGDRTISLHPSDTSAKPDFTINHYIGLCSIIAS